MSDQATCDGLSFSTVLWRLKAGSRVARAGWNGKGMWLQLIKSYAVFGKAGEGVRLLPWIGMKTADDGFVPWLANQTDLLAADWEVVR